MCFRYTKADFGRTVYLQDVFLIHCDKNHNLRRKFISCVSDTQNPQPEADLKYILWFCFCLSWVLMFLPYRIHKKHNLRQESQVYFMCFWYTNPTTRGGLEVYLMFLFLFIMSLNVSDHVVYKPHNLRQEFILCVSDTQNRGLEVYLMFLFLSSYLNTNPACPTTWGLSCVSDRTWSLSYVSSLS